MAQKKSTVPNNVSKSEKIKNIRVNRQAEKVMNRNNEKFDLVEKLSEQSAQVIEFSSKNRQSEEPSNKSSSRLMEKLKKKRDEEFGKK